MTDAYEDSYRQSLQDPAAFWARAAEDCHWYKTWDTVLDASDPPHSRWFSGAMVNTCYNCLDVHIESGRGQQSALIYDSPVTGTIRSYSYIELRDQVAKFAGVLAAHGVQKGDRVICYMPMIPEAVIAMLACARLGAVHSVVFGGFAAKELATRIDDAKPKVVVSASCGVEGKRIIDYKRLLDEAIALAQAKPQRCIIYQRTTASGNPASGDPAADNPLVGAPQATMVSGRDVDWDTAMADAAPHPCVPVAATDPLYILYTSGTTGQPKGVVRDNGGHMVALKWSMKAIYDVDAGDVFWAASDVGWVVGHSYIVYGPLLQGCTTVLFEGKPVGCPDAGAFWRVIAQHGVKSMFTAPTAFRAIKREDPHAELLKQYDLSHFKLLFLAGERSDPDTIQWSETNLGVPVIDHWWQTETGWAICAACMGLERTPIKYGSTTKPVPGWRVHVLSQDGKPLPPGQNGALAVQLPLPPGSLTTLWQDDERYMDAYFSEFPGYYKTADAGYIDDDGYVYVMSRTDDIINVAGHRLSTGAMEEVLADHPDVAECAVLGVANSLKGQVPIGLLVLNADVTRAHNEIGQECVQMMRERIGAVTSLKTVIVVQRLPKTRSGKILRKTIQSIADSRPFTTPATIDDPAILDEIRQALHTVGLAKQQG